MKTVVWTDGSCNANGIRGRGGWAALIEQSGNVREISGSAHGTTHNRMELTAICEALETLTGAIKVRTDSTYVEKCFNHNWRERWLHDRSWKGSNGPVKNRDLWERLFDLEGDARREVTFKWIPGHKVDGEPNNHRVDRLARAAALSDALPDSVETPAPARRRKPRRAPWRDLDPAAMAAHLLATPTINDRAWTEKPRLPRETRDAFIRRVLLDEMAETPEAEAAAQKPEDGDRVMSIVVRFKPTSLTAATYDQSTTQLEEAGVDPRPEGLDRHICFGTDGNLQVIEIWDSREQFEAFGERLSQLPVLAELGIEFSAPPEILDIHRIVKGEADLSSPS